METLIAPPLLHANASSEIYYPDSDGQPIANNTEHGEYIATTKYGLESVFADREDVFVAMDVFWYPVKGKPRIAVAPDVMVALGRPKGDRKSYKQWEEDGIAPQVVFEFLSESNTQQEMTNKAVFFERHGVQEYYIYDLVRKVLSGFIRFDEQDDVLEIIPDMNDWKSPRLGIRFDMSSGALQFYKPDGTPFQSYHELDAMVKEQDRQLGQTREQLLLATRERDESIHRANILEEKLRELGINPQDL
jgi:Uma2 family endonuclease